MLYLLGKEELLPHSFRKQIPFSTISTWRKVDYSSYIGHEYRRCGASQTSLCLKRYPNQLTKDEVRKMKALLTSSKFQHWPIVSIAAYALRKGFLMASLFTWYKYARLLQLSHEQVSKAKTMAGLVATSPNEYWHCCSFPSKLLST